MSWAAKRETKREEDVAYSLLGIFDIHMPLIYGEGREKALVRLHKEIKESLKAKSPTLPPALFLEHQDKFKGKEGTASISLLYLLILIKQLTTLLGSCHSNEIPASPVVSSSLQSSRKCSLLEVKLQRSLSWGLAV